MTRIIQSSLWPGLIQTLAVALVIHVLMPAHGLLAQEPFSTGSYVYQVEPAVVDQPVVESTAEQPLQLDALLKRLEETESRLEDLESKKKEDKKPEPKKEKKWFEKYTINGYVQFRINENLSTEEGSASPQHVGDGSVGQNKNFFIRRARAVLSGDVTDHISIYFQPDFASSVPGSTDSDSYVQLRDLYTDLHFDTTKVYRIRLGQSKVPYGWENMQSSRNRLPLDRNDALNSAVRNERDLGAFFYWTPEYAQEFFEYVVDEGLKGSGNFGVFGLGVYNGQGGSLQEQNDNLHVVSRLTLPMTFNDGQMMELAVQGYTGKYDVLASNISPLGIGPAVRPLGTLEAGNVEGIRDERIAGTIVYYPQPFGFQSEWTVGRGPGLNDAQTEVIERALYGGYAMIMSRHVTDCYGEFLPFARYNYYKGGYKTQRNAPYSHITEWEMGVEWQISKYLEFVGMYTMTDRTNTSARSNANQLSYAQYVGDLLRFQVQLRY
jgi:hypothetical protein